MLNVLISIQIVNIFVLVYICQALPTEIKPLIPSESYLHKVEIDDDQPGLYTLFWKMINNDEIQFEIHAKAKGYVGIGVSPNGGMAGADIAIGWVDDLTGKANLKDCYANGPSPPLVDAEQNWNLLNGVKTNDYTILKLKRKLKNCDKSDRDIEKGSTFMIFAWSDQKIVRENGWSYHGENRRTKNLLLFSPQPLDNDVQINDLPDDTVTFDIRVSDFKLVAQDTYYYCETYEIPVFDKDMHLIQFEMLINKTNKDIVHHYDGYLCNDGFQLDEKVIHECATKSFSDKIGLSCINMFVTWSTGGQYNYTFPKDTGYPLIKANEKKFMMITVHYDNPRLQKNRVDNSGIRFYLTPTLQKYEMGLMVLGIWGRNPLAFVLPPQQERITFTSFCYPECIDKYIPEDGINIVSAILHTHLTGRSVRTMVVRNNQTLDLISNKNYDFNYQYAIDIEPFKIKKGDVIVTQCTHDSMDRNNFTFIGISTRDEMCNAFIYYYPAVPNLKICGSEVSDQHLYKFYDSMMKKSLLPKIDLNRNNSTLFRQDVANLLKSIDKVPSELSKNYKTLFEGDFAEEYSCGKYPIPEKAYRDGRFKFVDVQDKSCKVTN